MLDMTLKQLIDELTRSQPIALNVQNYKKELSTIVVALLKASLHNKNQEIEVMDTSPNRPQGCVVRVANWAEEDEAQYATINCVFFLLLHHLIANVKVWVRAESANVAYVTVEVNNIDQNNILLNEGMDRLKKIITKQ